MFSQLVEQMKQAEGITEQLKVTDQLEWVRRMNSIRNRAEEIILNEIMLYNRCAPGIRSVRFPSMQFTVIHWFQTLITFLFPL